MNGELQLGIELLIALIAGAYLLKLVFSQYQQQYRQGQLPEDEQHSRTSNLRLVYPGVIVGLEKRSLFGQHPVRR